MAYYLDVDPKFLSQIIPFDESLHSQEFFVDFPKEFGFSEYLISTFGRIYDKEKERLVPYSFDYKGYIRVKLSSDERDYSIRLLTTFTFLPYSGEVKERDGIRWNNHILNFIITDTTPFYYFPRKEINVKAKIILPSLNQEEESPGEWREISHGLEVSSKRKVKLNGNLLTPFSYYSFECVSLPWRPIVCIDQLMSLVFTPPIDDFILQIKKKKPVDQYTLDGKYVRTFESITEAARAVGSDRSNLKRAIQKGKVAKRFKWFYS